MDNYLDKIAIQCKDCGHMWILVYDKWLTNDEYVYWLEKCLEEHHIIEGGDFNV